MKKRKFRMRQLNHEQRDWVINQLVEGKKYENIGIDFVRQFPQFAPLCDDDRIARLVADRCKGIKRRSKDAIEKEKNRRMELLTTGETSSSNPEHNAGTSLVPLAPVSPESSTTEDDALDNPLEDIEHEERRVRRILSFVDRRMDHLEQQGIFDGDELARLERTGRSASDNLERIKKKKLELLQPQPVEEGSPASSTPDYSGILLGAGKSSSSDGEDSELDRQFVSLLTEQGAQVDHYLGTPPMGMQGVISNLLFEFDDNEREAKEEEWRRQYPLLFSRVYGHQRPAVKVIKPEHYTVEGKSEADSSGSLVPVQQSGDMEISDEKRAQQEDDAYFEWFTRDVINRRQDYFHGKQLPTDPKYFKEVRWK